MDRRVFFAARKSMDGTNRAASARLPLAFLGKVAWAQLRNPETLNPHAQKILWHLPVAHGMRPNGDGRIVARILFSQSGEDPENSTFTAPFHLGNFCHPRPTCNETNGQNFLPRYTRDGMHACSARWKIGGRLFGIVVPTQ
jgi:hypothetical protein